MAPGPDTRCQNYRGFIQEGKPPGLRKDHDTPSINIGRGAAARAPATTSHPTPLDSTSGLPTTRRSKGAGQPRLHRMVIACDQKQTHGPACGPARCETQDRSDYRSAMSTAETMICRFSKAKQEPSKGLSLSYVSTRTRPTRKYPGCHQHGILVHSLSPILNSTPVTVIVLVIATQTQAQKTLAAS